MDLVVHKRFVIAVLICKNSAPFCNNNKGCPICNSNKSHSGNSFQKWFIGTYILQVLPIKIWSFGHNLLFAR